MKPVIDYSIYLVTDRHCLKGRDFFTCIEEALRGGTTLVQLREKQISESDFIAIGKKLHALCASYGVPLIINDNITVARKVQAAGVHLGQDDGCLQAARNLLGPDAIIGISAHNIMEARLAQEQGADYLGVGAVYPTGSKSDAREIGLEKLQKVVESVTIPCVGIGGIGLEQYKAVRQTGTKGCAMISAILGSDNIKATVESLKKLC